MPLTISTTRRPATDLGYLLHKQPGRFQSYDLSFGKAHVFYPEAADDRCTTCLLLDVDPVGLVRGKRSGHGLLDQYVNSLGIAKETTLSELLTHRYLLRSSRSSSTSTRPGCRPSSGPSSSSPARGRSC